MTGKGAGRHETAKVDHSASKLSSRHWRTPQNGVERMEQGKHGLFITALTSPMVIGRGVPQSTSGLIFPQQEALSLVLKVGHVLKHTSDLFGPKWPFFGVKGSCHMTNGMCERYMQLLSLFVGGGPWNQSWRSPYNNIAQFQKWPCALWKPYSDSHWSRLKRAGRGWWRHSVRYRRMIPGCNDLGKSVDSIECHGNVTKAWHYTDNRVWQNTWGQGLPWFNFMVREK